MDIIFVQLLLLLLVETHYTISFISILLYCTISLHLLSKYFINPPMHIPINTNIEKYIIALKTDILYIDPCSK